jgi:hypothetical protein
MEGMQLDQAKLAELAAQWNPFPVLSQLQAQTGAMNPGGLNMQHVAPGEWDWMKAGPTTMPGMPQSGSVGAPTPAPGVGAPTMPATMPAGTSAPLSPQQLQMLQNMQPRAAPPHYAPAVAPQRALSNLQFVNPSSASASAKSGAENAPSLAMILSGRR